MTEHLYRHREINIRTIENIVNHRLSFSIGDTFNDPFDATSRIPTKFYFNSYCDFIRYNDPKLTEDEVLLRAHAVKLALNPEHPGYESVQNIIASAISQIDIHLKNTYIACLNKNYREPLLWSHYANGHRGICLKFNKEKLTDNEDVILSREVEYSDIPIDIFKEIIDTNAPAFRNYLFKKSSNWDYEKEYRLISRISRHETLDQSKFITLNYEPKALETIIFGAKCKPQDILTVMKLTETCNISYSRLTLSETNYCCSEEIIITKVEVEDDVKNDIIYMP